MVSELRALQNRFLSYIREADRSIEADVTGSSGTERARRLSIYYNAYRVRFRDSIETDHPVLGLYLGDELFDQMVSTYIDACPSRQTSLRHFCDPLPAFLARQKPFADYPVLADIARFERILMDAFDAADAPRADDTFVQTLRPEQWPELRLQFHPSVRCFETAWKCVEIWRALKAERVPPEAGNARSQMWLIWRNRTRLTEFRSLAGDERSTLKSALDGASFATLCEVLLETTDESQVAIRALELMRGWLSDGLLVGGHDEPS